MISGRNDFRRILIIKPSSFGDVIHALPVLHALRERYPQAHISWLVANSCAGLLEGHPGLDEIIRFDRKRYGRLGREWGVTHEFLDFLAQLRARRFDLVLDLQGLFRSGFFAFASGAAVRIGFANAREFAPMCYTQRVTVRDPDMHAVDRNYLFGRLLGFADVPIRFDLPVQAPAQTSAAHLLAEAGVAAGEAYVLLGPGTRWETKLWPAEYFAELAGRLRNETSWRVVLVGMKEEEAVAARVAELAGGFPVNLAGRTSLAELIALVDGAAMVVMHDSGPMHLATALGKPMVALYGPTSPKRTGPYCRSDAVARLELPCSPCYIKTTGACPHGHRCMREMMPADIMRRVRRIAPG